MRYEHYENAVDYYIKGIKEGNPLTEVFKERSTRTGKGEDIQIKLSMYMMDHEFSHEDYKEDINEYVYGLVKNDPNY